MKRREFIATASLAAAGGLAPSWLPAVHPRPEPLVGVQIAPFTIFDEGIEQCLDTLKEKGNFNALFIYSQTYHMGAKPPHVLAADHGVPVRNFFKSNLPDIWVRHRPGSFSGQLVRHQKVTSNHEYAERDLFSEIQQPAAARGMKVYARILEAGGRGKSNIPGYEQVQTVDHLGHPGSGPCWNHPAYREWVYTTIRELVSNYRLDGLQYGAERTGPLSHVLFQGIAPTCFCAHCIDRNQSYGIDAERAKVGFGELFALIGGIEAGRAVPDDGLLTSVLRVFHRYPEVLSWDYHWFQADDEISSEVHRIAKDICPQMDSGRHVDHQRSSWDVFYRSAMTYDEMAENADFIKPIVYHETMGPRLRWWVLQRMQERVLNELTLQQSLDLFYSLFGHDAVQQPTLDELEKAGLGPQYVYRETRRCKQAVGDQAKVYAGIGIDVPWYTENGMETQPSDPEQLEEAVRQAFAAGADGILASREYDEMRLSSLEAFARGVANR